MGWLFEGLIELLTNLTCGIMRFFVSDFWTDMGIAEVTIKNGVGKFQVGMAFDNYLPGAGGTSIRKIFKTIAMTVTFLLLMLNLLKAYLPQELSQTIQHPFESIGRAAGTAIAVMNAYLIMVAIQSPMAYVFNQIQKIANDATWMSSTLKGFGANSAPGFFKIPFGQQVDALVASFITLFIILAITWAFIQLMAEVIERYVIMCFLFYAAPLGLCGLASNTTQNITTSYFRMIFSQYLLMMLNLCFVYVFCYAFSHQNQGNDFSTPQEAIIFYLVLLAWLKLGRSLDEHMRTLGLSAAQTGRGLAAEAMIAGGAAASAAKTVFKGIKKGTEIARKGGSIVKDRMGGPSVPGGDTTAAYAVSANTQAGAQALASLGSDRAQMISNTGLTGKEAVKAASDMTGIPESMIQSADIPKDFASQGMTLVGEDGSAMKVMPVGGKDINSLNAAGVNDDSVHSTFSNGENDFVMYPIDSKMSPNGLMASDQGIGHDSLANALGVDPKEDANDIGQFNTTVDEKMSNKLGVPEGNYVAYDTDTYKTPENVSVHHSNINGRDVSFVNKETFPNFAPEMKGYMQPEPKSGAEKLAGAANVGGPSYGGNTSQMGTARTNVGAGAASPHSVPQSPAPGNYDIKPGNVNVGTIPTHTPNVNVGSIQKTPDVNVKNSQGPANVNVINRDNTPINNKPVSGGVRKPPIKNDQKKPDRK